MENIETVTPAISQKVLAPYELEALSNASKELDQVKFELGQANYQLMIAKKQVSIAEEKIVQYDMNLTNLVNRYKNKYKVDQLVIDPSTGELK